MTVAPQEAFVEPGKGAGLLDVLRRRFLARLLVRKESGCGTEDPSSACSGRT